MVSHSLQQQVSGDCCVSLPRGAMGLSAVCDCGISWSYSLTILEAEGIPCMMMNERYFKVQLVVDTLSISLFMLLSPIFWRFLSFKRSPLWYGKQYLRTLVKSAYQKTNLLISQPNICCGYSKEPSQWDSSFEHPKHMLKLIGKKIFAILRWHFCLSKPVYHLRWSAWMWALFFIHTRGSS